MMKHFKGTCDWQEGMIGSAEMAGEEDEKALLKQMDEGQERLKNFIQKTGL